MVKQQVHTNQERASSPRLKPEAPSLPTVPNKTEALATARDPLVRAVQRLEVTKAQLRDLARQEAEVTKLARVWVQHLCGVEPSQTYKLRRRLWFFLTNSYKTWLVPGTEIKVLSVEPARGYGLERDPIVVMRYRLVSVPGRDVNKPNSNLMGGALAQMPIEYRGKTSTIHKALVSGYSS